MVAKPNTVEYISLMPDTKICRNGGILCPIEADRECWWQEYCDSEATQCA